MNQLQIEDMSESSFGKASVGRRYAEKLVDAINQYSTRLSSSQLSSGAGIQSSAGISALPHFHNFPTSSPKLTNFEIGFAGDPNRNVLHFHSNSNGDLSILQAYPSPMQTPGNDSLQHHFLGTRLIAAFECLCDRMDSVFDLKQDLVRVLERTEVSSPQIDFDVLVLRDHKYEVDFTGVNCPRNLAAFFADFDLGTIKDSRQSIERADALNSVWIGHGQALLLVDDMIDSIEWDDLFQGLSLMDVAESSAMELAECLDSHFGEPQSRLICPVVIKRK